MPTIKVKQGECISSIAYRYNLLPDTIWNDPANAELKALRKDQNILMPGDKVVVRKKEMKEAPISTGSRHRFQTKGFQEKLVIHFKLNDKPRTSEACVLEIDGVLSKGQTDGSGKVEIPIPPNAKTGMISFRETGDVYKLDFGHLDPIEEISGIQGRLSSLGFYDGPINGKMSEELEQAIRDFQETKDMKPTGKLDDTTRNMIEQAYEE